MSQTLKSGLKMELAAPLGRPIIFGIILKV